MSSGPVIKNLVRLSLLEQVSPELLVRFLRPFEDYLAAREIRLDGTDHDHDWVGALHQVLVAVDPEMPGRLQQALLDIADLASAQGHEMALELVGERQLVMFGPGSRLCVEDLAFQMYLEHADLFTASHARVKSQEARRFVDFFSDEHTKLSDYGSEATRVQLVHQLRRWFAERNRSEYIDLRLSETDDEVSFLVIHGCTPRNVSVITSPFSRDRLSYVPDRQDTIILSKREGRLSVNAQYPAEQDFYRQLFGRVYFGRQNYFESCEVLSGDVLLDDPEAALSVTGLPGLSRVTLRELTLEAHDHPHDTLHWKAFDLRPVLARGAPRGPAPAPQGPPAQARPVLHREQGCPRRRDHPTQQADLRPPHRRGRGAEVPVHPGVLPPATGCDAAAGRLSGPCTASSTRCRARGCLVGSERSSTSGLALRSSMR